MSSETSSIGVGTGIWPEIELLIELFENEDFFSGLLSSETLLLKASYILSTLEAIS